MLRGGGGERIYGAQRGCHGLGWLVLPGLGDCMAHGYQPPTLPLPLVPARLFPVPLCRAGCASTLRAWLDAFRYTTVCSSFFRPQAGNAPPDACLLLNCVLENIREKKKPSTIVFPNTKLRKNTLFCQRFKNPCSCFSGQDCTPGRGGDVIRYEALVTILPGRSQALLLGRSPRSRVHSDCSRHLSARLPRCAARVRALSPCNSPCCCSQHPCKQVCCSTGYRHTRHRFMPSLPLGQAESSFQQQELKLNRVGKA